MTTGTVVSPIPGGRVKGNPLWEKAMAAHSYRSRARQSTWHSQLQRGLGHLNRHLGPRLQQQLDHQFKHRVQPGLQRFGREAVTANSIREMKSTAHYALSMGKKLGIGLVGGLVLLLGIAFIVLPGPAILVIPAGLAILALEFEWARRGLDQFRQRTREFMRRWRSKR